MFPLDSLWQASQQWREGNYELPHLLPPVASDSLFSSAPAAGEDYAVGIAPSLGMGEQTWVVALTLAMLAAVLATLLRHWDYWSYRIQDFVSDERRFNEMSTQNTQSQTPRVLLLVAVGICSVALLALQPWSPQSAVVAPHFDLLGNQLARHFLHIFGLVAGWLLLKTVAYQVVNWTFFPSKENGRWMSAFYLLNGLFGVAIFALAALKIFVGLSASQLSFCLLVLVISYKFLVIFKLKSNFKTKNYGYLLIFLYFCTLELAPALIVWHFVANNYLIS